jgi:hypothetical protein
MVPFYKLLLGFSGMSQREAATFHEVSLDSIKNWCTERSNPPARVIEELRQLNQLMMKSAVAYEKNLSDSAKNDEIDVADCARHAASNRQEWPCQSVENRVIALAVSMADTYGQKEKFFTFRPLVMD